jgi:hypothetical protein
MKITCNIILEFGSTKVQEKILHLYKNLEKQGSIPHDINLEQKHFDPEANNLIFISLSKNNGHILQSLMNRINIKTTWIIIVPHGDENYFDFAIEYNICNIIHIDRFNEITLLGILRNSFNKNLDLESFFISEKNLFNKNYSISGNINMHKLIENTFADFLERIKNPMKNVFIINCYELVSNAIVYGVLGVPAYVRDKENYKINYTNINIPENKDVKIRLIMNENVYGISVKDSGGLLTTQRILERVRRQSIVAGETIPQGIEDYTGRGLAILSHHGLLLFTLKSDEFTEVSLVSSLSATIKRKPISILTTEL